MTLTQLRYLLSVAEYGNFTLAAEKSFVTQPTLSMQIQKLEEELEVKIFNPELETEYSWIPRNSSESESSLS